MRIGGSIVKLSERFHDRMRSPAARRAANGDLGEDFEHLRGRKYCLLVTYRRSGQPVPTPVWFGLDGGGTLYLRSTADAWKVKRVRANADVRVAPCDVRGKPLGPAAEGRAQIVPPGREELSPTDASPCFRRPLFCSGTDTPSRANATRHRTRCP